MAVTSLLKWAIMIIMGAVLLFTVVITIKLMQSTPVWIVMGVLSGLLQVGTSSYTSGADYVGFLLIIAGVQ